MDSQNDCPNISVQRFSNIWQKITSKTTFLVKSAEKPSIIGISQHLYLKFLNKNVAIFLSICICRNLVQFLDILDILFQEHNITVKNQHHFSRKNIFSFIRYNFVFSHLYLFSSIYRLSNYCITCSFFNKFHFVDNQGWVLRTSANCHCFSFLHPDNDCDFVLYFHLQWFHFSYINNPVLFFHSNTFSFLYLLSYFTTY